MKSKGQQSAIVHILTILIYTYAFERIEQGGLEQPAKKNTVQCENRETNSLCVIS